MYVVHAIFVLVDALHLNKVVIGYYILFKREKIQRQVNRVARA
jgi:hypothetical protein